MEITMKKLLILTMLVSVVNAQASIDFLANESHASFNDDSFRQRKNIVRAAQNAKRALTDNDKASRKARKALDETIKVTNNVEVKSEYVKDAANKAVSKMKAVLKMRHSNTLKTQELKKIKEELEAARDQKWAGKDA